MTHDLKILLGTHWWWLLQSRHLSIGHRLKGANTKLFTCFSSLQGWWTRSCSSWEWFPLDVKAEPLSEFCGILPINLANVHFNMAGEIQEERKQKPMLQRAKYNALVFPSSHAYFSILYFSLYAPHSLKYDYLYCKYLWLTKYTSIPLDVEMQLRNT